MWTYNSSFNIYVEKEYVFLSAILSFDFYFSS
jgi:hypothetical protein